MVRGRDLSARFRLDTIGVPSWEGIPKFPAIPEEGFGCAVGIAAAGCVDAIASEVITLPESGWNNRGVGSSGDPGASSRGAATVLSSRFSAAGLNARGTPGAREGTKGGGDGSSAMGTVVGTDGT